MHEQFADKPNNRTSYAAGRVVEYLSSDKNCIKLHQFADFLESTDIAPYAYEPEFVDAVCRLLKKRHLKRSFLEYLLWFYDKREECRAHRTAMIYIRELLMEQLGKAKGWSVYSVMALFNYILVVFMEIVSSDMTREDLMDSPVVWLSGCAFSILFTVLIHKDYLQLYKEYTACVARLIVVAELALVITVGGWIGTISKGSAYITDGWSPMVWAEVLDIFFLIYAASVLIIYGIWMVVRK